MLYITYNNMIAHTAVVDGNCGHGLPKLTPLCPLCCHCAAVWGFRFSFLFFLETKKIFFEKEALLLFFQS